jgi:hypothetical protein
VEDRGWKLSGAEDLAISGMQVKMERLREIVAGLENGDIKFRVGIVPSRLSSGVLGRTGRDSIE